MRTLIIVLSLLIVASLLLGCQPTPTAAPKATSAPAAAATTAPAASTAAPVAKPTTAPVAAATAAPTAAPAPKVKRGGSITYARNNIIDGLDIVTSVTFNAPTASLVYEHLLNYELIDAKTGKHELKPQLAESWDATNNKRVLIKLKKGIKFSDGSDLTAEVAKWNLDRVRTHAKSQGKYQVSSIDSVDVVDANTIAVNLKAPSATMLLKLSNGVSGTGAYATTMASKAAVDKGGAEALHTNPIGTGPMVLDKWLQGDRVTLKKRDGYWQNGVDGQPLPYFDSYTERYIADGSVQNIELRTNNIQITNGVLPKDVAALKANPELVYEDHPWGGTLQFNYAFNQYTGPFKDNLKLRQAAQYALDKDSMAKTMGFGLAKASPYGYWVPGVLGYDPSVIVYKYDQAKAKQLLAEAGYPNGIDVPLNFIARDPDRQIAEIAKAMWDSVGIRTTLDSMERAAGLQRYQSGNFTIGFYSLAMLPDPDLFAPKALICDGMNNWTNWCNKEFVACIAEGGSTLDDKARDTIYKRCLKIYQEDAFLGSGYQHDQYVAYTNKLKGTTVHYVDTDLRWAWLDR
jgi:peptide/nickel transport system substrate-binding protein